MTLLLRNQNQKEIYPPNYNKCPDYWTSDSSGNCFIPTKKSFSNPTKLLNMGDMSQLNTDSSAPYSSDAKSFNSQNLLWESGGKSTICAQKTWANNYGIMWDGVSNYNKC
jgi:hypothetical protein